MNRREFNFWALRFLSLLALRTAAPDFANAQEYQNDCVPWTGSLDDFLLARSGIPDTIKNEFILGYPPIELSKAYQNIPDKMLLSSYSLLIGSITDCLENDLKVVVRPFCDREGTDLEVVPCPYEALYKDAQREILERQANNREKIQALSYDEKLLSTVDLARLSFRKVLYQEHSDPAQLQKTPPRLYKDNVGDCKDYAFSRHVIARSSGVKPEHTLLILYLHKMIKMGHTNMAIFHPTPSVWTIIDGTGRQKNEIQGSTMAFDNEGKVWQNRDKIWRKFIRNMANLAPILGIINGTIFAFDSIQSFNPKTGKVLLKKPHAIPERNNAIGYRLEPSVIPARPKRKAAYESAMIRG